MFPGVTDTRKKINMYDMSVSLQRSIRDIVEELKKGEVAFRITEQALQLKIMKSYDDIDWGRLGEIVNSDVSQSAKNLDKSYLLFKECSYGSVELTRREKTLQRKKDLLNFHHFDIQGKSTQF